MSRIGKQPIVIPDGVTAEVKENKISVKGPKGILEYFFDINSVSIEIKEGQLAVNKKNNQDNSAALWGTTRALVNNMVKGTTEGFEKRLELNGVGYKMAIQGKKMVLNLGFSHPVEREIPAGLEVSIEKNILIIRGIDKQLVGQFSAEIRALKKIEPYKGKGFKYEGEQYQKKEGKKTASSE